MPSYKTPAVALYSLDFAEWDKIVTFFTRDFGKVKGVAKGAKRSRKRFGSGLEPFTHVTLSFFEKESSSLVRLNNCEIIESYPGIHDDVLKVGYANYLGELVNEMVAEREASGPLFKLFTTFLHLLNEPSFREEFIRIFELRLLALSGYQPELSKCVVCQKKVNSKRQHCFSLNKGGLVCADCFRVLVNILHYPGDYYDVAAGSNHGTRKVTRLYFSPQAREESKRILARFIEYHLEKPLKSLQFLEHLGTYQTN